MRNANSLSISPLLAQRTYARLATVLGLDFGFHRFSGVSLGSFPAEIPQKLAPRSDDQFGIVFNGTIDVREGVSQHIPWEFMLSFDFFFRVDGGDGEDFRGAVQGYDLGMPKK